VNAESPVRALGVTDPEEAQHLVSQVFLPHRLRVLGSARSVDMDFAARRLGDLSAGLLSYGESVRVATAEATNFHVNIPLRGTVFSRTGAAEGVALERGLAGVFPPGAPADMSWSEDCAQLCLMVSREKLEDELERLLGRSLGVPLSFEFTMDLRDGLGRLWQPALELVHGTLADPSDLADLPLAARHIESMVLDGLLIGQPHNCREQLSRSASAGPLRAVSRAAQLFEEQPGEPWNSVRLAQAVHLSVRALQEGFKREFDVPPMTYLRQVRLRRAREALLQANRESETVRSVATRFGFVHMSRFASMYRQTFGEAPSTTLALDLADSGP
jgi:AraC-like DNA-binding protein